MMIDRLQEVLPHLQYLPSKAQEESANHIKELEQEALAHGHMKEMPETGLTEEPWEDPARSLSDLPGCVSIDKLRK